jgi:hypothetical protein
MRLRDPQVEDVNRQDVPWVMRDAEQLACVANAQPGVLKHRPDRGEGRITRLSVLSIHHSPLPHEGHPPGAVSTLIRRENRLSAGHPGVSPADVVK